LIGLRAKPVVKGGSPVPGGRLAGVPGILFISHLVSWLVG
jgi:hypothetical protein